MTLLLEQPAWIRRPVGVVRVTGDDRLGYLHQLLSQSVEDADPGDVRDFLYLDAKGAPVAAGRLLVHAEAVLLAVPPELAADVAARLEQFKFLLQVTAVDASDEFALASVRGPEPPAQVGARDEPMTAVPHPGDGGEERAAPLRGGGLVVRDRSGGLDLLGDPEWIDERATGLGLPEATTADWERWRILHGEVDWDHEVSLGRRPQELGLLPTHVHLRKGCYPGQESIAKTYNLGQPRRVLCIVDFDGRVEVGTEVAAGDRTGTVTSAARDDGGTVALALLPRDRATGDVVGGGEVTAGDVPGRVVRRVGEGLTIPGAPDEAPA